MIKIQVSTHALTEHQCTRLQNACAEIQDWLELNDIPPADYSVYPCPCCGDVMLSYSFTKDQLSKFERLEREFWKYVQTLFPIHKTLRKWLSKEHFKPLISARIDDRKNGEWTLVVQPCESTYGVGFPGREFWKEVNERMTAEERRLN